MSYEFREPAGGPSGVPVSRLYLRPGSVEGVPLLDVLCGRFPHVSRLVWKARMESGRVVFDNGEAATPETSCRGGRTVFYHREVRGEAPPREAERIVFRDSRFLVADKPPGMPVIPAGDVVEGSLLARLRRRTGLRDLTPAHRIDRETSGVVLFVVRRSDRGPTQQLFARGEVEREYRALARRPVSGGAYWKLAHRIAPGEPWFRQVIVGGPPNAFTEVEQLDREGAEPWVRFRIRPRTGRKHQIRVQMAGMGSPILGDPLYGEAHPSLPLQLVAARLGFRDPASGGWRWFESGFDLVDPGGLRAPM